MFILLAGGNYAFVRGGCVGSWLGGTLFNSVILRQISLEIRRSSLERRLFVFQNLLIKMVCVLATKKIFDHKEYFWLSFLAL